MRAEIKNRAVCVWTTYLNVLNQRLHVFIIAKHRRQTWTITARLLLKFVVDHRPVTCHHHHHHHHYSTTTRSSASAEIARVGDRYAVQGHSRSPTLVPLVGWLSKV